MAACPSIREDGTMGMVGRLAAGTLVRLRNHKLDCVVGEFLGSGGQGEVYRAWVRNGAVSQSLALKWYFPEWSTRQQWSDLAWLTEQAPPSAAFLWPIDMAVATVTQHASSFGYVMPLRPRSYRGCVEIVSGRLDISFSSLLRACMRLADAFLSLHAKGLCYRDISFGNAFVEPTSGDVLICDNDNVAINLQGSAGIRGTDRFMAPEIVRGETTPSVATDLYSLAVLLFYLLMVSHPLEGQRMLQGDVFGREEAAELYGWHPLFVFDPVDASNAPDQDRHRNAWVYWPLYPLMLRDLFVRAFTDGLRDPDGGRVREGEWRDSLARLLDLLIRCHCGAEIFVEPDGRPVAGACWSCASPPIEAGRLPMLVLDPDGERHVVALDAGRRLYAHHLRGRRYDYREVGAEVVRHPVAPDVIGLRNLSADPWIVTAGGGASGAPETMVFPGRSVTIASGTHIDFGPVCGVVENDERGPDL